MEMIKAVPNPFGGLVVESADLPASAAEFRERLVPSIAAWKEQKAKVVWLSIARSQADLIPAAVEAGCVFHHALADSLQLTLTRAPGSFIPPFATHYVGAGGVVVREDGRLLVVSERYKLLPGRRLKLPGGALNAGEHISSAVVREVKEETGIDARFESVVCFRHWHGYRYGKSDIYFVCRLTPLTFDIKMDEGELAECLWLPVADFLADPDVHAFNKRIVRIALGASPGLSREIIENYGTPETHELLMPRDE